MYNKHIKNTKEINISNTQAAFFDDYDLQKNIHGLAASAIKSSRFRKYGSQAQLQKQSDLKKQTDTSFESLTKSYSDLIQDNMENN